MVVTISAFSDSWRVFFVLAFKERMIGWKFSQTTILAYGLWSVFRF